MASMDTLQDALVHELKDLLSAEKQLTAALPKLQKKATSEKLRQAFADHLAETEGHVERLKEAIELLGKAARAEKCDAMAGLIKEGEKILKEEAEDDVKDAMLIAAAQKVEHYEIASYGTACAWAKLLGLDDVLKLLKQTMAEEEAADEKLTAIATSMVNEKAAA